MSDLAEELKPILADLLLAVADDKLVLGHRNSDWTGLAPMLEEDIAFSSIAQDELAHAQALYAFAGPLVGKKEDQLAFGRGPEAYRCATIVELPDDFDWAVAIARQFFCDHFDRLRLERLSRSAHGDLAALAARLAAEEQVHVEHVAGWVRRLGTGTDESRARMQAALDRLAPAAPMLFEPVADEERLVADGLYPGDAGAMYERWASGLKSIADDARLLLALPERAPAPAETGGRRGRHTEHLGALLDEMGEVYRLEPDAAW